MKIKQEKQGFSFIRHKIKSSLYRIGQKAIASVYNYIPKPNLIYIIRPVIVITRICNANCVFCVYQFLPDSERVHMPNDVFENTVRAIKAANIKAVSVTSNSGEPLLVSDILDKIKALRDAGVEKIHMGTNAILLDRVGIKRFLEEGPDYIYISTTAFDPDMYKRLYRSDQYERMRDNIMNLLQENSRIEKRRFIAILIRSDIEPEKVYAMPATQKIILLADKIEIRQEYNDCCGVITPAILPKGMKIMKPRIKTNRPCHVLMQFPAIYPNGDIAACACQNYNADKDMYLGNVNNGDFIQAIDNLSKIIESWKHGWRPQTCNSCSMYSDPALYWPTYIRAFVK